MTRAESAGMDAWEAIAAKKMGADLPRSPCADFVDELAEDAEAVACDEWADVFVGEGVERRTALKCAARIWEMQRARDAEAAGGAANGGSGMLAKAEAMEALGVMAIKLVQASRPRFSAGCFLLAAGIEHEGVGSQRQWAARQNMSPEQASNEVIEWQRALKLPRTKAQKSERACRVYKQTNGRTKTK